MRIAGIVHPFYCEPRGPEEDDKKVFDRYTEFIDWAADGHLIIWTLPGTRRQERLQNAVVEHAEQTVHPVHLHVWNEQGRLSETIPPPLEDILWRSDRTRPITLCGEYIEACVTGRAIYLSREGYKVNLHPGYSKSATYPSDFATIQREVREAANRYDDRYAENIFVIPESCVREVPGSRSPQSIGFP